MKRYLLFTGYKYENRGGWAEFHASFDSVDEALDFYAELVVTMPTDREHDMEWYQIVDLETEAVISEGSEDEYRK